MPRRILEGSVISNKADKTVTVLVERRFMHPVYKKYIRSTSKYKAHDETNSCQEGDRVQIIECRPLSKTKRWAVLGEGQEASLPPLRRSVSKAKKLGIEPAAAGKGATGKGEAKAETKPEAKAKVKSKVAAAKSEKKADGKKADDKKTAAPKKTTKAKKD